MIVGVTFLSGCGRVSIPQTENDVTIKFWRSGVGQTFLDKAVENFQKKYPQYRVYIDSSTNRNDIKNNFGQGYDVDKVDIWIFPVDSISSKTLKEYAEPLNNVLTTKYEGESITIGEKYESSSLEALKWPDNNYYSLSYGGGWYGIVYNEKIINGVKYKLPRTTEELEYLTIDLYHDTALKNMPPYIHYADGGYWDYIYKVWQAQYDGMDYYTNTFMPLNGGESDPAPSKAILLKEDGRKKAIEAMSRILKPSYVYNGSNSMTFTDAQTLFIQDKAVMMVNGSWLLNEMKSVSNAGESFKIMKTPVISSIIEKCATIADDAELAALIDAIDAASNAAEVALSGIGYEVSRADADKVYEARNIMSNNFDAHGIVIPTYAVAKNAAKEFVKYFYSDENLANYWEATQLPLPVTYSNGNGPDMSTWGGWEAQQQQFTTSAIPLYSIQRTSSVIFTAGGARPYAGVNIVSLLTANNADDRADSSKIWNTIVLNHTSKWQSYLTNAQL